MLLCIAALVYEVGVYHHTGYGMWVDEGGTVCEPGKPQQDAIIVATGEKMEFKMDKQAKIQYSSEALIRLSGLIPEINPASGDAIVTNLATGFVF